MTAKLAQKLFKKNTNETKKLYIDQCMIGKFIRGLRNSVYPQYSKHPIRNAEHLELLLEKSRLDLFQLLTNIQDQNKNKETIEHFFSKLGIISDMLDLDAAAILSGDPAARDLREVILCYPGFFSIFCHRVAHFFYREKITLIARLISEHAHQETGIEIHPGATIGQHFCIDHGTGVVIGETAEIGEHVKIYQGVTLGALSVDKELANVKRHPTIKSNTVIYSNATLLGGETVIGNNCIIGGNVWLTKSIPDDSIVYHKSEVKLTSQIKNIIDQ